MNKKYPFSAIIGQDELLLAIILNIINPKLGGLLIKGVKGSGKSTAVYSMVDIMPEIEVMALCKFNCDPDKPESWCDECKIKYSEEQKKTINKPIRTISVPLSITEDRLLGNINVELLLKEGKYRFIPGVLADAHRQILYIDEVNLLSDYIIDDILDVSAMRWNQVEREGFSIAHPAEFLLFGTMNPEEGELRPQILDRFPLSVLVKTVTDEVIRKEIIKRNLAFESNPQKFIEQFQPETENLRNIIKLSRKFLGSVQINPEFYTLVVQLCTKHKIDGHRADINIIKSAITYAAFEMKEQVETKHIRQAAKFVLCHRTREGGLSKPLTPEEIDDFFVDLNIEKSANAAHKTDNEIDKNITSFSAGNLLNIEKK